MGSTTESLKDAYRSVVDLPDEDLIEEIGRVETYLVFLHSMLQSRRAMREEMDEDAEGRIRWVKRNGEKQREKKTSRAQSGGVIGPVVGFLRDNSREQGFTAGEVAEGTGLNLPQVRSSLSSPHNRSKFGVERVSRGRYVCKGETR